MRSTPASFSAAIAVLALAVAAPLSASGAQVAPAAAATTLPYPAYGTPAPGVGRGETTTDVPQTLTLQQAIAIGFARSPILASARADEGLARAATRLARAGELPNVAGTLSSSRSHRQLGGTTTAIGGGAGGSTAGAGGAFAADVTTNALSANVRELVFDGGRIAAQVRAASHNETAAAETYRRQLQAVAFSVANAYYNALAAQRTTAVAVEVVNLNQTQENLVLAQVRAGTAARVDVATAQLPTAQARLAVVRSQGNELSAQAAFANAMGLDANVNVQPVDDTAPIQNAAVTSILIPTYNQALARAYALRPDYSAAQRALDAARESLRAARLGTFPTLSANAGAQATSSDPGGGSFRNASSIGASITIPIFDQGLTAAQTAQAQANVERSSAILDTTRLGIGLNVKQTLVALVTARAGLDQAQAEFAKATEVLQATQAQYRAGVTTLPLLLNAQVGLTQALTDRVTAIYGLRQAEQAFLFAEGANT